MLKKKTKIKEIIIILITIKKLCLNLSDRFTSLKFLEMFRHSKLYLFYSTVMKLNLIEEIDYLMKSNVNTHAIFLLTD